MKLTDSRFIATLVMTNVVALAVIAALMWMLWQKNTPATALITGQPVAPGQPAQPLAQQATGAVAGHQPADFSLNFSLKRKTVSMVESVIQEVKAADIDSFLAQTPGDQARAGDAAGKALTDRQYIAAFSRLSHDTGEEETVVDGQGVAPVDVVAKLPATGAVVSDHFNKVDLKPLKKTIASNQSLAGKVAALVDDVSLDEAAKSASPAWKDYLDSLKSAEAERKNEMRTIRVKQGETLWRIAMRAYGDGHQYTRIFAANPHLKDPASILAGEVLRVPL